MESNATPVRRPVWPWVLAVLAATVLGAVGGWTAAVWAWPGAVAARFVETPAKELGQAHSFAAGRDRVSVAAIAHVRRGDHEGVQVRACNKGESPISVSSVPWLLSYDNGDQLVDIAAGGGGPLAPPFVERELAPGRCVTGWISFEGRAAGRPDGVEYRIDRVTAARWEW
jgi:hypothetical protein